jgi:2-oxoglutarate ferredoxin oxidoreductase subunit beta
VTTGDGDCYGEGGNHFLHNIRRNCDITVVVCDNQIYGLTKGQASPTTDTGYATKVQVNGVILEPFHPLAAAIALGCGFVARGFSGDPEHLSELIAEGVRHKGFALIDVLQPCVTFNKKNTHDWYSKRVYKLDKTYDPLDRTAAYAKAEEWGERIPLGIIYQKDRPCYEQLSGIDTALPLCRNCSPVDISGLLSDFE